ncbi:MAG: hypothetical protein Q8M31_04110 [Beijerinckiaceae bacterium]|nr:hypothetical protein [Beijerinckiaceae bacterium]
MIRAYVAFVLLVSSGISIASLFRSIPLAVMIAFPMGAGLFSGSLFVAFFWSALNVPTDRAPGLLAAGGFGLLAALNLGAAIRAIIRRR